MTYTVVYDSDTEEDLVQFSSDSFIAAARFYLEDKLGYDTACAGGYDDEKWSVTLYKGEEKLDSFGEY